MRATVECASIEARSRKLLEMRTRLSDLRNKLYGNEKLETLLGDVVNSTEKMSEISKGGAKTALCPVPKHAGFFGWPCGSEQKLPAESKVRVMKSGFHQGAVCRYWVQSGPLENASGDAPCEWFVAE